MKLISLYTTFLLSIVFFMGCSPSMKEDVKMPEPPKPESQVAQPSNDIDEGVQLDYEPQQPEKHDMTPAEKVKADIFQKQFIRPPSLAQLKSITYDLEAFRVFTYHFQLQKDGEDDTFEGILEPIFEYIQNYVDPILSFAQTDDDQALKDQLIHLYFTKAYLLFLINDIEGARDILSNLRSKFPNRIKEIQISQFDTGPISVDQAILKLGQKIRRKFEKM